MATEHVKQGCWEAHSLLFRQQAVSNPAPNTKHNSTSASFFLVFLHTTLHSWKLQFLTESQVEAITQKCELL